MRRTCLFTLTAGSDTFWTFLTTFGDFLTTGVLFLTLDGVVLADGVALRGVVFRFGRDPGFGEGEGVD